MKKCLNYDIIMFHYLLKKRTWANYNAENYNWFRIVAFHVKISNMLHIIWRKQNRVHYCNFCWRRSSAFFHKLWTTSEIPDNRLHHWNFRFIRKLIKYFLSKATKVFDFVPPVPEKLFCLLEYEKFRLGRFQFKIFKEKIG